MLLLCLDQLWLLLSLLLDLFFNNFMHHRPLSWLLLREVLLLVLHQSDLQLCFLQFRLEFGDLIFIVLDNGWHRFVLNVAKGLPCNFFE